MHCYKCGKEMAFDSEFNFYRCQYCLITIGLKTGYIPEHLRLYVISEIVKDVYKSQGSDTYDIYKIIKGYNKRCKPPLSENQLNDCIKTTFKEMNPYHPSNPKIGGRTSGRKGSGKMYRSIGFRK